MHNEACEFACAGCAETISANVHYMGVILVKTELRYKKIAREYRLVRDFNNYTFEVSQSVLLRCTRTDAFVNKFSNLSELDAYLRSLGLSVGKKLCFVPSFA